MERELWRWDAVELAAAIRTRKVSSREAVHSVLERLETVNPAINAVTVVLAVRALATADAAHATVKRGEAMGPLHGVPVTIKENIDQAGQATAHGNDLGGSIRYPAYCCGVAGIRTTLGRVPAYNQSAADERPPALQLMSVQGPLARRVRDVRLGLQAMAARDPRDPWWSPAPLEGPPASRPIRVALSVDPAKQGVHPDVAAAVRAAGAALSEAGYAVEEADPPDVMGVMECWAALIDTEIRHVMLPYILKHGDADVILCTELMLASSP